MLRREEKLNPFTPFATPAKNGALARAKADLLGDLLGWYHARESFFKYGIYGYKG